ncbi:MAG: response regulator transcription factor [Bifidobacteriaceae bacterium]|nr:response regulator transcription factor [Bifidobacteriaceae bacterium]
METVKPRILVVEDQTELVAVIQRRLEAEGYTVTPATTLAEARAALRGDPQDLVLLDVMLPDGSGYDFAAEARQLTAAPIIFLTALSDDAAIVKGLAAGGDDYITKPFSLDVVAARVKSQLRRAGLGTEALIDLPPLRIDLLAGQATLGGVPLKLTATELKLLAFFASNAGRGFTQEQLLEQVWRDTSGVPTNTVRVHISNLRRKLKLDADSPFELNLTDDLRYVFQRVSFPAAG